MTTVAMVSCYHSYLVFYSMRYAFSPVGCRAEFDLCNVNVSRDAIYKFEEEKPVELNLKKTTRLNISGCTEVGKYFSV